MTVSKNVSSELIASNVVSSSEKENDQIAQRGIIIFRITRSKLEEISEFVHDKYHRCGGYVVHDSLEEAKQYIKDLDVAEKTPPISAKYTMDNPQEVEKLQGEISSSNLLTTVNTLMRFQNRHHRSSYGIKASHWIKKHWENLASTRSDIDVALINHASRTAQPSVVVTIDGKSETNEIVVIGSHLDSINGRDRWSQNQRAPGADDDASGIAVLTEVLRVIVKTDYKPKKTIQIMGFAAEEVGLVGSKLIARDYRSKGKNVVGMVNFDMTGYKGSAGDIYLTTDHTNSAQNRFLENLIDKYLKNLRRGTMQCGYACSDHASWHGQGFAASFPTESTMRQSNPKIHTTRDTKVDQAHMSKFAKLAVTYLAEMAKSEGGKTNPEPSNNQLENGVSKTGLKGQAEAKLYFTMKVPANQRSLTFKTSGGTGDADLYVRFRSKPSMDRYDCRPWSNGNHENCHISNVQAGTYHVMLYGYSQFNKVKLMATYN